MASVHDYLKKLLYQYDCVVVPELGAFLTHYQPAAFTEATGLYLPPRKRVAFNEALRFDDGILANYVMLHEPVTREGAQRHISQFVGELRDQVKTAGRFELDDIGTFSRNDEGKLQFDPSLRHNFFGEAYGMSALSVQAINRLAVPEPTIEAVPLTAAGPILIQDDGTTLIPMPTTRPYWQVAAAILLIGSLGAVSYFSVVKPGQPLQSSLNPANLFRLPAALTSRSTEMTKTSVTPVNKPESKSIPPIASKPIEIATPAKPVAVSPAPVTVESKPAVDIKPEPVESALPVVAASKPMEPHYTVIAGVFSKKQSAMPLIRHLHKSGYPDAYVMVQGRKALRYKVAAIGSDDKMEAQSYLPAISKMIGSHAWIYSH